MADTRGGVSARTFYMAALVEELEATRFVFQYILHLAGINVRRSLPRDPPTWTVINARAHSVPHRTVLAVIMGTSKRLLRKMSAQATAVRDHSTPYPCITLVLYQATDKYELHRRTGPPCQGKNPCSGPRNSDLYRWRPDRLPVVGRIPCPELR
jgi:hypothetical protein